MTQIAVIEGIKSRGVVIRVTNVINFCSSCFGKVIEKALICKYSKFGYCPFGRKFVPLFSYFQGALKNTNMLLAK